MNRLIIIFSIALFASCNGNQKVEQEKETTSPETEKKPEQTIVGCYMKITGRDTTILKLEGNDDGLTGKMLFDNYEKDSSRGTVKGKVEGGIIKIWYDFFSEGMHSVMEIYFKESNGKLLRGIGDIESKGDSAYYKNPAGIQYSETEAFQKGDCEMMREKLNF